jgi:hypothetical protein
MHEGVPGKVACAFRPIAQPVSSALSTTTTNHFQRPRMPALTLGGVSLTLVWSALGDLGGRSSFNAPI